MIYTEGKAMGNCSHFNRLAKCGFRPQAEAYKEEVRRQRRAAGDTRNVANQVAEDAMWVLFGPIVEQWEAQQLQQQEQLQLQQQQLQQQQPKPDPDCLIGCTDDVDQFLDPDYSQPDPGRWLRDGLIWTAAEIRRVVTDSPEGITINLARAQTPPPTAWAVFCLESFARLAPSKRGDLIARVLPFATKSHETQSPNDESNDPQPNGFLDALT
jgi:hypothetical protein